MQSNNPVFRRSEEFNGASNAYGNQTYAGNGVQATPTGHGGQPPGQPGAADPGRHRRPMTIDSVVQKTAISLVLVIVAAAATWVLTPAIDSTTTDDDLGPLIAAMTIGSLGAFGAVDGQLVQARRSARPWCWRSPSLEGVALGAPEQVLRRAVSATGIVMQAVIGTFAAFAGTLAAYKFFNIQVGQKFRTFVIAAVFGMVGLSLLELVLSMFGSELGLFGFGGLGLLFADRRPGARCLHADPRLRLRRAGHRRRHRRARVVAGGLRADRQPGLDLHQPAAHPGDPQLGLTAPNSRRPAVSDPAGLRHFRPASASSHASTASTRRLSSARLRQVELGEDAVGVLADRLLGDEQPGRDRGVRAALGHQRQHLPLAGGEPRQRRAPGRRR